MHRIGIIPVNTEILCRRREGRHTAHGFIVICGTVGVRILRHAPDPLDAGVFHQFFHLIHVGSIFRHGHRYHVQAKIFRNGKMPVIAGYRAQERDIFLTAPGFTAGKSFRIPHGHSVKHQIQAAVGTNQYVFRRYTQQFPEQFPSLGQSFQHAIAANIVAVYNIILFRKRHVLHGIRKADLLNTGLATGHIQRKALGLKRFVCALQFLLFLQKGFLVRNGTGHCHQSPYSGIFEVL